MNLRGKRVLVTGAAGGIGSSLVRALVRADAHVILAGRDALAMQRLAATLSCERDVTLVVSGDLTSPADRLRLCEAAKTWQGGIDILINNAAINDFGLLMHQEAEHVARAVNTNVIAPIELCRLLLPHLAGKPDSHIVNVGSVFGSIGYAGNAVYSATKFALRGFSEAMRRECAGSTVNVHYFAPRATATAFNSSTVDEMNFELGNAVDTPDTVAGLIVAALLADRAEAVFGWPERLFVRINALWPGLVDRALRDKLETIRRFASSPRETTEVRVPNRRRVG